MTKYVAKNNLNIGFIDVMPGEILEIKKLKHPTVIENKKYHYYNEYNEHFMSKQFIKDNFTKGTYKSETPKRILKTLLIIAVYELSKYVTNEIIVRK